MSMEDFSVSSKPRRQSFHQLRSEGIHAGHPSGKNIAAWNISLNDVEKYGISSSCIPLKTGNEAGKPSVTVTITIINLSISSNM